MISSQEYSQAPPIGATARSQQPSPEFLGSLGIKVRDFAYENTLPAIVPVPRVPRQVQPAPVRALKRLQRDWDDKEGTLNSLSPSVVGSKKHKSLERRPTEPLQEPVVQHTRTLERITVKRVCSILTPPSRSTLPTTPRTRFSASPPTSPLTPLSRFASLESEPVQTSPAYPFVVHVNDTSMVPASQLDAEDSQPLSLRSVLYTRACVGLAFVPVQLPRSKSTAECIACPLDEFVSRTTIPNQAVRSRSPCPQASRSWDTTSFESISTPSAAHSIFSYIRRFAVLASSK
ncbi:hypothetical protein EV363DRAFT_524398 [Boletus edulis]|nr:hypothetical protein EV363DRAFT_524398 [Boletus edulis]